MGIDGERARWLAADTRKSSGWWLCARKTSRRLGALAGGHALRGGATQ
jgi:hypothetical protein